MRVLTPILIAAVSVVGLQAPAHAADKDCDDFSSQQAAQLFFLNNNPSADPHGLDADGDGVVCESLPGPYYYGSDPNPGGGGGGGGGTAAPAPIKVVKVINGELVRVRQGSKAPYVVHLMGVNVPDNKCKKQAARKDLRSWVKPGQKVKVTLDNLAPKRDKQGNERRYLTRVNGNWDIGGRQIDNGFGKVERHLRFRLKVRYLRWERQAQRGEEGFYGIC